MSTEDLVRFDRSLPGAAPAAISLADTVHERIVALATALETDPAAVVAHPVVDLRTGRTVALDAAVVATDDLLAVAEPDDLAAWHRARVAATAAYVAAMPEGGRAFTLDLPADVLARPGFVRDLPLLLALQGLRPEDATIRIPDLPIGSTGRDNPLHALVPLREAGLGLCLTDFTADRTGIGDLSGAGAGYVELPVDLCIDMRATEAGETELVHLLMRWRDIGFAVVMTGLRRTRHVCEAVSLGVEYGTGPLFDESELPL